VTAAGRRALSAIAAISGLYDILVGAFLLLFKSQLATWFGTSMPVPAIHADLNGIFLLAVGAGYWMPYREPVRHRGYLWVMGPILKGAGALAFVLDYWFRGSPSSFLLFAASDGTLGVATLAMLLATREHTQQINIKETT
jgi:hypothetical protein